MEFIIKATFLHCSFSFSNRNNYYFQYYLYQAAAHSILKIYFHHQAIFRHQAHHYSSLSNFNFLIDRHLDISYHCNKAAKFNLSGCFHPYHSIN
jgi:hypothetical protein